MINLIICGAAGRMGQAICEAAKDSKEFTIAAAVEGHGHPLVGKQLCEKIPAVVDDLLLVLQAGDVIIDFSTPEATAANAAKAAVMKKPMVIGTTGLDQKHQDLFAGMAKDIPMVVSSNMSIGVNLLYKLAYAAAKKLPKTFDADISETHHRNKKDAPSGTAVKILEEIQRARGGKPVYQRQTSDQVRGNDEIGMVSLRAGDIVGEHSVIFTGPGEQLELIHRAQSRRVFADGALLAAKFVAKAKPGLYDMQDVLGL
ncbi:4-hydroxy-tetrahydrodipicolinate reductase [candidate division TA06 bacterium]|uniref:4-hydroxy-tetrahydrodipicolinate reductase n=1 Tax=candidate division TA06 bacterium TaxID=2250710 RepID=A0A933I797_UNCT6|nr:4-hydroxy-tetrahydrodipicolinate reductase [candidate division TA06 bacterium]